MKKKSNSIITFGSHIRELRIEKNIGQRELAKKTGVSLGSVNYCLKGLLIKGYIKINNFSKDPNKLHYLYILTPIGISQKATLTKEFLRRKLIEYKLLKEEIERLTQISKKNNV